MTGYMNMKSQEVIDQILDINESKGKIDMIRMLWDIKNTYDVKNIGDITRMYRKFKDLIDNESPTVNNEERIKQALDNTRTHYKVITFNNKTPEPYHDNSHDDLWRE